MSSSKIPLRPKGFVSKLSQPEQSALTWYVLSGCARKDAYVTFARPDFLDSKSKAALDDYVKQFFASKDAREYIAAYEATLDEFLRPAPVKTEQTASIEERKSKAKTKLIEFAMSLANNIEQADDPEFVLKVADKAGLLDMDEEIEEQPRRYLPETCNSCAYRAFCEQNTEDMCPHCKYHKFGEENGIHYDKTDLLDISGIEFVGTDNTKQNE